MKKVFQFVLISLIVPFVSAQKNFVDSLHQELYKNNEDTSRVLILTELGNYYGFNQFDSAIFYGHKAIDLSKKLKYPFGYYRGLKCLFFAYNTQANYPKALEIALENLRVGEKIKQDRPEAYASAIYCLGALNRQMNNLPTAIVQLQSAIKLFGEAGLEDDVFPVYSQLALIYQQLQSLDSALWFAQTGYNLSLRAKQWARFVCLSATVLGLVHTSMGNYEEAKKYLHIGTMESIKVNNIFFLAWNYNLLANLFKKINIVDSCIYYARISLPLWHAHNFGAFGVNASKLLTQVYESQHKPDSTIKYMKLWMAAKDSVYNQSKVKEFEKFIYDEEKRKQDIQQAREKYSNRIKMYALLATMIVLVLIAFMLWRNNRQKQKSKRKIEQAYEELKSTQAQLIQSEKMASLGELTAGIAHEIQNPLNFVNNFSEVSNELIDEMNGELDKGDIQEAKIIADDIKQNLEKINHHGRRADGIVKGMLQHSRTSSGQKEPVEINKLADEYLRLSYHGLRAKDKSFNAEIKTDFDSSIGNINVVPQDFARVILNLINNAFYAVNEKTKLQASGYMPQVIVTTKKLNDKVEVRVGDNGCGIPQRNLDKIFQPFFTTKPTGQGTGLGLSLSYDIIKAHGGEIKVETKEDEGAVFIIQLPTR